jgi:hypothetical protein
MQNGASAATPGVSLPDHRPGKKPMRKGARFLLVALLFTVPAQATDDDGAALRACMRANVPAAVRVNRFEMTTLTDGVRETLGGTLYLHGDDTRRALTLQIDQPPHLDGSAFLFIERAQGEQMFVYLSAMNRVRQINGAAMDGRFFGSALRYSDIRQAFGLVGASTMQLLPDTQFDGAPARAMRLQPLPDEAAEASTLLVDAAHCVPLQLKVDRDGAPLREFSGLRADIVEDEGRWYLRKGRMRDHERKAETEIVLGELRGFDDIPMNVFNRTEFHRARFGKK